MNSVQAAIQAALSKTTPQAAQGTVRTVTTDSLKTTSKSGTFAY